MVNEPGTRLPRVAQLLAGAILVLTIAGVLRIFTVARDVESELLLWVAAVVLLVGFAVATIVMTCARVLKALDARVAAAVEDRSEPVDPWSASTPEPPDYVTG